MRPALRSERALLVCVCILASLVAAAFAIDVAVAFLRVPLDPREGWNAYHAAHPFTGSLYPRAPSLMYNNYPPVSFVVSGALGNILGDHLIAGRIVALVSTGTTAVFIFAIARGMGCARLQAAVSALLFLATPWLLSEFAGIDDPQLLGQALGTAGFLLTGRRLSRVVAIFAGALLLTLACFVKPIFIVQPLALLIWLAIYDRRHAIWFAVCGSALGAIGLFASAAVFGMRAEDLISARVFDIRATISHPGTWLLTGFAPLAATLSLLRLRDDPAARLCGIYALVAVIFALIFSGGQGVGGNAMLDCSIATALGTGVFLNRASDRHSSGLAPPAFLIVVVSLSAASLDLSAQLAARFVTVQRGGLALVELPSQRQTVFQRDIVIVRAHSGPAFCEALALCYWAGKAPQVDAFNLTQAFKRGARDESDLTRRLDGHYYALVQLDRRSHFAYSGALLCAFARNYAVLHADEFGILLTPRLAAATPQTPAHCQAELDRYLLGAIN